MRRVLTVCLTLAAILPLAGPAPAKGGKAEAGKAEKPAMEQIADYIETIRAEGRIDTTNPTWKGKLPKFPEVTFEEGKTWYWNLKTNHGSMKIRFFENEAPNHVANFIYLTELGYFDGTPFHRVIPGFMAQGGDPSGTGSGGPGYTFGGEADTGLKHDKRGILSQARRATPGTDGSQFFLTFEATPWLDNQYAIFGEIVEGMATLDALEDRGSPRGRPTDRIVLERAWITVE